MEREQCITYSPEGILKKYDSGNRLSRYLELLIEENNRVNLVSRETTKSGPGGLRRLAAESLLPLTVIDRTTFGSYLDIGSGGGIPAVPLLLTGRVERATLVERTQKKAAALRRILISLNIEAEIISRQFEEIAWDRAFDLVTLRLVKMTSKLLAEIVEILSPDGLLIHYSRAGSPNLPGGVRRRVCSFTDSEGRATAHFALYRMRI